MDPTITATDTTLNIIANVLTVVVSLAFLARLAFVALKCRRKRTAAIPTTTTANTRQKSTFDRLLDALIVAGMSALHVPYAPTPRAMLGGAIISVCLFLFVFVIVSRQDA